MIRVHITGTQVRMLVTCVTTTLLTKKHFLKRQTEQKKIVFSAVATDKHTEMCAHVHGAHTGELRKISRSLRSLL